MKVVVKKMYVGIQIVNQTKKERKSNKERYWQMGLKEGEQLKAKTKKNAMKEDREL